MVNASYSTSWHSDEIALLARQKTPKTVSLERYFSKNQLERRHCVTVHHEILESHRGKLHRNPAPKESGIIGRKSRVGTAPTRGVDSI